MINSLKPNILFVGVGAPKQEKWIYNHIDDLHINVAIGVGASFDFIAGKICRAPKAVQRIGMEWFWRFSNEPKRLFKRYFIDGSKFFPIIIKQVLGK
jgi:N-acetylglucosaminyldiphosphoundecaprenol N-acetyl-beta-D-mannosaminyltransferase